MVKLNEKKQAITLRKRGYSYREVLRQVPVAKSTLSLWLREIGLSKKQKQRLTIKKIEAAKRGAQAQRNKRLKVTKEIKEKAKAEIANLSINKINLWLMGIMLYWAEGAKERINGRPTGVEFGNSDPFMIKLFIKWLAEICKVPVNHIKYKLYIHENSKNRLSIVKKYWAGVLGLNIRDLERVYFKKHKVRTNRKRIGEDYFGLICVRVSKSTHLNRVIAGWIEGINQYYCRID